MTLQDFLDATADVPDAILRRAMVAALGVEPARTSAACRRFYDRVVRELSRRPVIALGAAAAESAPALSSTGA